MAKEPDILTTRWRTIGAARRERIRHVLSSDALREVFDGKFFERIEDRIYDLEKRESKFVGIQALIFLALGLSLIPIELSISILGISLRDTPGWRELLLVITGGLGVYSSILSKQV